MSQRRSDEPKAETAGGLNRPLTKKDQILALYAGGITEVDDLALITRSRPSYVAGVLQDNQLLSGYFDLYTTTKNPMNLYSKFFAGKLGFKDVETAQESVDLIDHLYRQFETGGDRAGQHHCLVMALTMFDRARWTNKTQEADVFRRWLEGQLREAETVAVAPPASRARAKSKPGKSRAPA
jgi:hypothetical protein